MDSALLGLASGAGGTLVTLGVTWGVMRADIATNRKALDEQRAAINLDRLAVAEERRAARRELESLRRELIADIQAMRTEMTAELRAIRDEARQDAGSATAVAVQVAQLRGLVDALPCRSGKGCRATD
jgi:Skp family chaperone for outer membrane proteins